VSVTGWAKGASYKPGESVTSEPANHSWNSVYIDGSWYLLDCHWATRHDNSADVKYDYDEFYFLTDPAEMIYSHFPEDAAWQLLPSPWTSGTVYITLNYDKLERALHSSMPEGISTLLLSYSIITSSSSSVYFGDTKIYNKSTYNEQ